jgi:hypothetical protein
MFEKYTKGKRTGIPWCAVLDTKGTMIVNSSSSGSNFGFPDSEEEIAAFGDLLKKSSKNINDSEIQTLLNTLKKKSN